MSSNECEKNAWGRTWKKSLPAHSDALYLDQRELLSSSWLASTLACGKNFLKRADDVTQKLLIYLN